MKTILDIFREIICDLNANISIQETVNFEFGHLLEIDNILINKEKSNSTRFNKYPLVALLQPFSETVNDLGYSVNLRLIIATSTTSDDKTVSRYDKTFKPVLLPIYEELMNQIKKSKNLSWSGSQILPPHVKTDRPFLGVESSQGRISYVMSDKLDAIEITNLTINFNDYKC